MICNAYYNPNRTAKLLQISFVSMTQSVTRYFMPNPFLFFFLRLPPNQLTDKQEIVSWRCGNMEWFAMEVIPGGWKPCWWRLWLSVLRRLKVVWTFSLLREALSAETNIKLHGNFYSVGRAQLSCEMCTAFSSILAALQSQSVLKKSTISIRQKHTGMIINSNLDLHSLKMYNFKIFIS